MHVPRQPVKLGNHEDGAVLAAFGQRGMKLGPVVLVPALHLDELRGQRALAGEKARDSLKAAP